jgi:hypothetical protein
MTPESAEVLGRASRQNFCAVAIVGILPNGGGLYVDWSGSTVSSLITMIEAAKAEAVQAYIEQLNKPQIAEAAE